MGKKILKIGAFGFTNVLKFATLAKKRGKVIKKTDAKPVSGSFPINNMAKKLHPDFQKVVITEIINHGHAGSKTYILSSIDPDKHPLAYFRAGQYISIKSKIDGSFITRPYSISSSPKWISDNAMAITIKSNPGGFAAEYYLNNLTEGDVLTVSGPMGQFYYEPLRDCNNVIAIAGGSGITPFLSMAYAIRDGIEDFNLTILYGNRNKDCILFFDELNNICKATNKVKVIFVLSEESAASDIPAAGQSSTNDFAKTNATNSSTDNSSVSNQICYETGFITSSLIKKYSADLQKYSIFICGPSAMYSFIDKELADLSLDQKYIRRELMSVKESVFDDPDYPKDLSESVYTLSVKCGPKEMIVRARANETVLVAIERSGIKAPSSCRSGECGYCRSKLVSGTVFVPSNNDGRRFSDVECNYIHPCCSFPTSDLVVEIPGEYY